MLLAHAGPVTDVPHQVGLEQEAGHAGVPSDF